MHAARDAVVLVADALLGSDARDQLVLQLHRDDLVGVAVEREQRRHMRRPTRIRPVHN